MNYHGIIKDKSSNKIIEQIFYRKFQKKYGALSESVNHEQESIITKLLSEKGYGPKLLYEVPNDYNISEYLLDTITLPLEKYFDKNIIEQLCSILNYFTTFSYVYKYKINGDNISLNPLKYSINKSEINIKKNQYEKYIIDIYEKTKTDFKEFSDKFKMKLSKEKNPKEWEDFELVQKYLNNFKKKYCQNFPSNGFLVINHNDVFSSNILLREKDQKIFLIDHEYFILNLPGYDLAYYLTEYFIKYEPEYHFDFEKIDFDKIFFVYENFIKKFIQNYHFLEKEDGGEAFLEMIKTKNYFLQLMNLVNLNLFAWSLGNANFENWEKNYIKEFFFVHSVDRIKFYLLGMNALDNLKK